MSISPCAHVHEGDEAPSLCYRALKSHRLAARAAVDRSLLVRVWVMKCRACSCARRRRRLELRLETRRDSRAAPLQGKHGLLGAGLAARRDLAARGMVACELGP